VRFFRQGLSLRSSERKRRALDGANG
jgi:hypothetical protein